MKQIGDIQNDQDDWYSMTLREAGLFKLHEGSMIHENEFTATPLTDNEPLKINITVDGRLMTPEELTEWLDDLLSRDD